MDVSQEVKGKGIEVRFTDIRDGKYLKRWLSDPETLSAWPMTDEIEMDDAVQRWIAFSRYRCSLTVLKDGIPCGIATLYLQPYKKLAHQSEFGIVVGKGNRGEGIGSILLESLIKLARETFKIEVLHLQVYSGNPAINLYKRFGFREFGRQSHWIKEPGRYVGRIFMEKFL